MPSFPQAPLGAKIELNLSGWTDITTYNLQRGGTTPPISVDRGRQNETSSVTTTRASMIWNNRDGRFSPRLPTGPFYGTLGRNTPVRVSVPDTATSMRSEDDLVSYVSTVAPSITTGFDARLDFAPSGYYSAVLINSASYGLFLNNDGSLTFVWTDAGSSGHQVSTSAAAGQVLPLGRITIRVTLNFSTGTVTFYTAPTIGGTFTQLAAITGSATSMAGGVLLQVGGPTSGGPPNASTCVTGRIYEFQLYNGIAGTLVADPQFFAQTPGVTTFTDGQSNLWALHGSATIDNRCYLGHVECSGLPQQWDPSGTDVWTPVSGQGLLRRLQQGSSPVASVFKRATATTTGSLAPGVYWPCEDPSGSTQIASGLPGGTPMAISGTATFSGSAGSQSADTNFPCSAQLPTLNGSTWSANVPAAPDGTVVVRFLMYNSDSPPAATFPTLTMVPIVRFTTTGTGSTQTYFLYYVNGGVGSNDGCLILYGGTGGTTQLTNIAANSVYQVPVLVSVELTTSGGTVTATVATLNTNSGVRTNDVIGTFSGGAGHCTSIAVNPSGALSQVKIGHLSVQSALTAITNLAAQATGYNGEAAGNRFARLCAEYGINFRVYGYPAVSAAMGPQPIDTLPNLLQYIETTDRGQLYEPAECLGIGYRTLRSMYNQPAAVSLNYAAATLGGDGGQGLTPTDDDTMTANDVTASRSGGSSYQYQVTSGDMSIQPPPNGVGDYVTSLTAYCQTDAQLPNIASWVAHVGTVDQERYPQIPLNLARTQLASFVEAIQNLRIGDHIQITNPPPWLPPGNIDQLVYGMAIKLGGFFYQITWNTVPESPYEVFQVGDPVRGRLNTDGSTLAGAVNSTATTLSLATATGKPLWTTNAGDFPFDILMSGERMTVTNITGASSPQTATVTRSVNGVVKNQTLNTPVTLYTLPALALT